MRIVNNILMATLFLLMCSCQSEDVTLSFRIEEPTGDKLIVTVGKDVKELTVDSAGVASVTLSEVTPQYVRVKYGRGARTLFLEPGKNLAVSFKGAELWKKIDFEGENAPENTYLNSRDLKTPSFNDAEKEETVFIQFADSLYAANMGILKAANFGKVFTEMEEVRLKYFTYANLPMYPIYHPYMTKVEGFVPTGAFYAKLKSVTDFDSRYLDMREYVDYIPSAVATLGMENGITKEYKEIVAKQIAYIKANVSDAKLSEYLVNKAVYGYVESDGVENMDEMSVAFQTFVKDPELIQKFEELCGRWAKIAVGNVSPSFKYKGVDGKEVALEDLKGKFVYIDVWATWCGPCLGELPHLQKLEHAYADKDIHFVSISCDQDKAAWEAKVEKDQLGGIQLHTGGDKDFMDAFLIRGIPRFLLLDREGKIVSADMSRPSNPETAKKFDELLGK